MGLWRGNLYGSRDGSMMGLVEVFLRSQLHVHMNYQGGRTVLTTSVEPPLGTVTLST